MFLALSKARTFRFNDITDFPLFAVVKRYQPAKRENRGKNFQHYGTFTAALRRDETNFQQMLVRSFKL